MRDVKSKLLLAIAEQLEVDLADLRGLDRLTIPELQSLFNAIQGYKKRAE